MNTKVFELLKSLEGKKITWTGLDKESESWVMMFDSGQAILLESVEEIGNPLDFATKILNEELLAARNVLLLNELINPEKAKDATEVESEPANN